MVAKRAGLQDRICGWHIGRHTYATHLALLGVNPWDLNQWMGHTRMEETLRYADVARAHGRSIARDAGRTYVTISGEIDIQSGPAPLRHRAWSGQAGALAGGRAVAGVGFAAVGRGRGVG